MRSLFVISPFDALASQLVATLDAFNIGRHEKDDLLKTQGPVKKDIVRK